MSVSARLISVLQGRGDEESEKLQALSEQIDTMQATQEAMREQVLSLQHQHGQPCQELACSLSLTRAGRRSD